MRKTAAAVSIFFGILFVCVAALTVTGRMDGLNAAVAACVQAAETPWRTAALKWFTNLGDWYAYVPLAVLLLVLPRTRKAVGVPGALALAGSFGLNMALKQAFHIPRPSGHRLIEMGGYGFPSGHAMTGAAFIGLCAVLAARRVKGRAAKIGLLVGAGAFLLLIGYSRIYLGVHDFSQIVAGYCAGAAVCGIMLFAWETR